MGNMDAIMTGIDETVPLAFAALHAIAEEMPLEVILLELRDIYRAQMSEDLGPDYEQLCDASVRALDAALWRLETESIS